MKRYISNVICLLLILDWAIFKVLFTLCYLFNLSNSYLLIHYILFIETIPNSSGSSWQTLLIVILNDLTLFSADDLCHIIMHELYFILELYKITHGVLNVCFFYRSSLPRWFYLITSVCFKIQKKLKSRYVFWNYLTYYRIRITIQKSTIFL